MTIKVIYTVCKHNSFWMYLCIIFDATVHFVDNILHVADFVWNYGPQED